MSRSFSAECETLGLSHLQSLPNAALGPSIARRLKDFSSHLRKNASPSRPHHQVLDAVSCAAGFPGWDAFGRAKLRLEAQDQPTDVHRAGFCDSLPLMATQAAASPGLGSRAFEAFASRVERHSGYDGSAVREALARFWGAKSYPDMVEQLSRQECAIFGLELDGDLVWPAVVGPLRELLGDTERRAALSEVIYAAARRGAAQHAATLEAQLAEIDPAFPEQERMFAHAKRLRDLPWGSTPPGHRDERASRLCAAYSYWAFCKDVVGKAGTRTWKQYETKYAVSWRHLLEEAPLVTEVPCPACSNSALVTVAYILGERQTEEQWELKCGCGHVERKSALMSRINAGFEPDSTLATCTCPSCEVRRLRAMDALASYATNLEETLKSTILARARSIVSAQPENGSLTLGENGEVFAGDKQVGRYRERVCAGVIPEVGVIARVMQERGGVRWGEPTSQYLERTANFYRRIVEVSSANIIELVFDWKLKAPFLLFCITDGERKHGIEAENRVKLDRFLGGFVPGDRESFGKWLATTRRFVGPGWIPLPVAVSIAKSADSLNVSPDAAIPIPQDFM